MYTIRQDFSEEKYGCFNVFYNVESEYTENCEGGMTLNITKKVCIIAMAVMVAAAFMPSVASGGTARAASDVMISGTQFENAESVGTDDVHSFGDYNGGDVTAAAYKFTAPQSGKYLINTAVYKGAFRTIWYTTGRDAAGRQIAIKDQNTILSLSKGKNYYFFFDSSISDKTGYVVFNISLLESRGVKFVSSKNKITIPSGKAVKFAFRPAATGYYKFVGTSSDKPGYFSLYQTEVKSTADGAYGLYNDLQHEAIVKKNSKMTIQIHGERYYAGMLKLKKGVTYYYKAVSGMKLSNFYIRKYSPLQIKISVSGCSALMANDYESYMYDMQEPAKFASLYTTIHKKEALEMAYFPESGKTLKNILVNGTAADYTAGDAEMVGFYEAEGGIVDDATFIDGKDVVPDSFVAKRPDLLKYLTRTEVSGEVQYYYTKDSLAEADGASTYKTRASYKYLKIKAPAGGWKTGSRLRLICE